jgi:hypothetical protein
MRISISLADARAAQPRLQFPAPAAAPGQAFNSRRQLRRQWEAMVLAETGKRPSGRQWVRARKADQREQAEKPRKRLAVIQGDAVDAA